MVVTTWWFAKSAHLKQPYWDRPCVVLDKAVVKSSLSSPSQLASFLAVSSSHSGDWLFALPIASCGLKLDDEAVRIGYRVETGPAPLCLTSVPLWLSG